MLFQRVLTALVLAPIMIGGIFFLPPAQFSAFIGLIVLLGAWEWANLSGVKSLMPRVGYLALMVLCLSVLYFDPLAIGQPRMFSALLWLALLWWLLAFWLVKRFPNLPAACFKPSYLLGIGLVILLPMWSGLMTLKALPDSNFWILYLMLVVWGADIGAYLVGNAIGRRKLAPNVSPGKSWEGVFGGLLAVMIIAMVAGIMLSGDPDFALTQWLSLFAVSALVFAVSVVGDLVESMTKRHRGMKDSSHILPGHGGIMDRIDSLTAAVPVFALLMTFVVT